MRDRLSDSDPDKWLYQLHTGAKHRLLEEYLKGWLSILTRGGQRRVPPVRLLLVDGFAGRGRYVRGEAGSPLLLVRVANEFVKWGLEQPSPVQVHVEIAFIESDPDNYAILTRELKKTEADSTRMQQVRLHIPLQAAFSEAIGPLLTDARVRRMPIFVFADPFGFSGIPLRTMKEVLSLPMAEVFVTFMVRDVNRFFDTTHRDKAFAELFGISTRRIQDERQKLAMSPNRERGLLKLYLKQLRSGAGAAYVWWFRVFPQDGGSAIYYLIHASKHIRAFRLMKDKTKKLSAHGDHTFHGRHDAARQAQSQLIGHDMEPLKQHMLERFIGQEITFNDLCDDLYPDPACYYFTEPDFRKAVAELRDEGKVEMEGAGPRGGIKDSTSITFLKTFPQRLLL